MTELKNIYTDKYTFLVGDYSPVDNEKLSDEGFTVILERPHVRTHERFDSLDEKIDRFGNRLWWIIGLIVVSILVPQFLGG